MLVATCHSTVRLTVPRRLSICNCSIGRRLGALWAYCPMDKVVVHAAPGAIDECVWSDRTPRTVRCRTCGCVTHLAPLHPGARSKMGINARIRLFDGASSWRCIA